MHYGTKVLQRNQLVPTKTRVLEQDRVVECGLVEGIQSGLLEIHPDILEIGPDHVVFVDGRKVGIDKIVLATGYGGVQIPFMDKGILGIRDDYQSEGGAGDDVRIKLYKHVFSIMEDEGQGGKAMDGIAFIGLVKPRRTHILPIIEMQARWACAVFAKKCQAIPSAKERRDSVDADWMRDRERFAAKARFGSGCCVDGVEYMDEIGEMVGCVPDLWKLWREQSGVKSGGDGVKNNTIKSVVSSARDAVGLSAMILFGPWVSAQYRLMGPGAKRESAEKSIARAFGREET